MRLLLLLLLSLAAAARDYRDTVIRLGYGVIFDKVDHVIGDGGDSKYTHTWLLKWPVVPDLRLPVFDCAATTWEERCGAINSHIESVNNNTYDRALKIRRWIREAKDLIPAANITAAGRTKRDLPDWLKDKNAVDRGLRRLDDFMPGHLAGHVLSSLFGTPGSQDLDALRDHLANVGNAVYENVDAIRRFDSDVRAFSLLENKRITNLFAAANQTNEFLDDVIANIGSVYELGEEAVNRLANEIDHTRAIYAEVLTKILPAVQQRQLETLRLEMQVDRFVRGVRRLTEGYLSPLLIGHEEIRNVLERVNRQIRDSSRVHDFKLITQSPSYYYNLQSVAYTHLHVNDSSESVVSVSLTVPLVRLGYMLPVYRVDVYPVSVTAGLAQDGDGDYTLVTGLPDYIAVDPNHQTYVELSAEIFHSCKGQPDARICFGTIPAIRRRDNGSCAFAIFTEQADLVSRICRFRYLSKWDGGESATQISADNTYVMRGVSTENWDMTCPSSDLRPSSSVSPCETCRVQLHCFCALSGDGFFLPPRTAGCTTEDAGLPPRLSYLYHPNTIIHRDLADNSTLKEMKSYETLVDRRHPPIPIPKIAFHTADNFTAYAKKIDRISADFRKTVAASKTQTVLYEDKIDAALNETRDFRDQVASREGSLSDALHAFFNLFGGPVSVTLTVLFCPTFFVLVAFAVTLFDFAPNMHCYLKERTERRRLNRMHIFYSQGTTTTRI